MPATKIPYMRPSYQPTAAAQEFSNLPRLDGFNWCTVGSGKAPTYRKAAATMLGTLLSWEHTAPDSKSLTALP